MSDIIDINGRPASTIPVNEVTQAIGELEQELSILLTKYNGRLPPAAAAGTLQWMAMNIFHIATTNAMMQNAAMMAKMKEAAAKIPVQ